MLQVKKNKRGIDNIFALLRYTFPKLTRVFTPSHITVVSAPMAEVTEEHNMEVTVTGISEITTGEVVLPYQAFDLTNCDCPTEIAAEMFSLTQVKAFLATKPIAIDELLFTREGDSYRVTAEEGAFTVFGEKVFTLAEDPEGEPEV